jgi:8-oxo-dGTP diphosphatase
MARAAVLAAGGIVLRQEEVPLIAVVRQRKRNEWVLPKGKLNDGETPRDAAEREVLEETGHEVSVHEFLGTLVYESGGRSKVVYYWRMEASGGQAYELMDDVRAVDWLPLDAAVERLSRGYERTFLAHVGPLALETAALARSAPRPKARPAVVEKRKARTGVATKPSLDGPISVTPQPDLQVSAAGQDEPQVIPGEVVESEPSVQSLIETPTQMVEPEAVPPAGELSDDKAEMARGGRRSLVDRVRNWLRRAA